MNYYQELNLLSTPDIPANFIWSRLYFQLHLALVEQQRADKTVGIGVSFPEYLYLESNGETFSDLGLKLRVFASSELQLEKLNLNHWLERLTDYIKINQITQTPKSIDGFLNVKRYRRDFNMDRVTRRYAKRRGISFEEARLEQNKRFALENNLTLKEVERRSRSSQFKRYPFIELQSLSGGGRFLLSIQQIKTDEESLGAFSTYGLSSKATVPHW